LNATIYPILSLHDKILFLSAAKRWSAIVRTVPAHLTFIKKLEKLHEMFSASGEEKTTASACDSIASSKRKRGSCNVSDDDSNSMSGDSDDNTHEVSKTQQTKKREKVDAAKGPKKTPLGNILSSLLRKKEGFPVDERHETDYTQESKLDTSSSVPNNSNSGGRDAELSVGSGDLGGDADCQVDGSTSASTSTESAKGVAAASVSDNLIDSTSLANATGNGSMSDRLSSERKEKEDYMDKKRRKLIRIQKRLRKIMRAEVRERKGFEGDCSTNGMSTVYEK
jgi:hypothetical protein